MKTTILKHFWLLVFLLLAMPLSLFARDPMYCTYVSLYTASESVGLGKVAANSGLINDLRNYMGDKRENVSSSYYSDEEGGRTNWKGKNHLVYIWAIPNEGCEFGGWFMDDACTKPIEEDAVAKTFPVDAHGTMNPASAIELSVNLPGVNTSVATATKIYAKFTKPITTTYVAQIGETKYETLAAAVAAAKSGETIKLLDDLENIGTVTLPAGVTIDGLDGETKHTISGASGINIPQAGGCAIKNIRFVDIHNNSVWSDEAVAGYAEDYGINAGYVGTQSAIVATPLKGELEIRGCFFDNIDWDAIQITCSDALSDATISIVDNEFRHTNATTAQLRYIHIQSVGGFDSHPNVLITDNRFYNTAYAYPVLNMGLWHVTSGKLVVSNTIDLHGNWFENTANVVVANNTWLNPMRSQADIDEDDKTFVAQIDKTGSVVIEQYFSVKDAVAAANKLTAESMWSSAVGYIQITVLASETLSEPLVVNNVNGVKIKIAASNYTLTAHDCDLVQAKTPAYLSGRFVCDTAGKFLIDADEGVGCQFQGSPAEKACGAFRGNVVVEGPVDAHFDSDITPYHSDKHFYRKWYVQKFADDDWQIVAYTDETAKDAGLALKTSSAFIDGIGGTRYFTTLTDIKDRTTSVGTITLLNDIALGEGEGSLPDGKTIDLKTYKISGPIESAGSLKITNSSTTPNQTFDFIKTRDASLTLNTSDRSWASSVAKYNTEAVIKDADIGKLLMIYRSFKKVTIEGGRYKGDGSKFAVLYTTSSEKSELVVKGGIFGCDQVYDIYDKVYKPLSDFVAEGYMLVNNTDLATKDDYPYAVVPASTPEVEVTVPETIPVKDAEGNAVSAEAEAAAGEVVAQVKQDIASNKIPAQHTGTGVRAIENTSAIVAALQTQADAFEARAQVTEESSINKYVDVEVKETKVNVSGATATFASIVFNVTPKAEITIVSAKEGSAGEEKTLTTTVANADITEPITFRLPLPNYFTVSAIVKHAGDPDRLLPVKGETNGKYVEVTVTHFSEFEVEPSDEVSTTVGSSTVLGIKRRADVAAGTVAVSVPWLGTDGNAIAVQNLIAKDCLKANDELHVWNGTGYDAWKWSGSEWEPFTSSTGVTSPTTASLIRGKAAWLKRATAGSIIQIGQYNEGTISTAVTKGHNLLINPKSEATPFSKIPGTVGDQISVISAAGKKIRYEYNGTQWGYKTVGLDADGLTTVTWTPATEIPADTGFWYIGVNGTPTIQW